MILVLVWFMTRQLCGDSLKMRGGRGTTDRVHTQTRARWFRTRTDDDAGIVVVVVVVDGATD